MGNRQFTNEASAVLAVTMTTGSTTIALATGFGTYFPSPSGTEFFIVAVQDTSGNYEYIAITGRTGDTLTVAPVSSAFPAGGRGQEGTSAQAFTMDLARVELRATAGLFQDLYQKDGDTLTGPMDLGGQTLTDGTIGTNIEIVNCNEIVNVPIRGKVAGTANQITVPIDGVSRAQAGGVDIVVKTDPINAFVPGMILMFNGSPADLPTGWHVCDGTTPGVPDLRDYFIVGAGNSYALGVNGNIGETTSAVSAGTPAITPTALSVAQLAAHSHTFNYKAGASLFSASGYPTDYVTGGSGSPGDQTATTADAGTGATHTHTASALPPHSHTVTIGPFYALYFAQYTGT